MALNDPRLARNGGILVLVAGACLTFIQGWEGNDREVYADALAGGLPTACGGITKHTSPYPVIVGDIWSEERCDEVQGMVLKKTQLKLLDCVTAPDLGQNTFDALTSHSHNFGVGATCASRAVGLINRDQLAAGCKAISVAADGKPAWSYVQVGVDPKGKPILKFIKGLENRRKAETAMCLKDVKQ